MERIRNIYCWNELRDWVDAQNMGLVHVTRAAQPKKGVFEWEQMLWMAQRDCFPQSLLCFRQGDENRLMLTEEQARLFAFLNNEAAAQEEEGKQFLFADLPAAFRRKILNARVDSIWIRADQDEIF